MGVTPGAAGESVVAGVSPNWLTTRVDFLVNWARSNSMWPMPFGTACCAIEFMATAASRYDIARFGMERMSFSPRQADVLLCAGRLPFKLAPVIRRIYDQMPQPKWVISMGACASSGGIFDNYAMVQWTSMSRAARRDRRACCTGSCCCRRRSVGRRWPIRRFASSRRSMIGASG